MRFVVIISKPGGTPDDVADILRSEGYACRLAGPWNEGDPWPGPPPPKAEPDPMPTTPKASPKNIKADWRNRRRENVL